MPMVARGKGMGRTDLHRPGGPLTARFRRNASFLCSVMGTITTNTDKPRYSAEDLKEFEELIHAKLAQAEETLRLNRDSLQRLSANTTDDTYSVHDDIEDATTIMEREDLTRSVVRQEKFISQLKAALGRIRTGEYGVCRMTGQLIPKERLRLVPHATLTVEAKNQRPEPRPEPEAPVRSPEEGDYD